MIFFVLLCALCGTSYLTAGMAYEIVRHYFPMLPDLTWLQAWAVAEVTHLVYWIPPKCTDEEPKEYDARLGWSLYNHLFALAIVFAVWKFVV